MSLKIYRIIHLAVTGIITIPTTLFVASGGIGENYTENTFVYPQFLLVIAIWIVGSVLSFNHKTFIFGLSICAFPAMFFIGNVFFTFIF